jgi:hypothetical protein
MSDYPICNKILEFQDELIDLQETDEEKFKDIIIALARVSIAVHSAFMSRLFHEVLEQVGKYDEEFDFDSIDPAEA